MEKFTKKNCIKKYHIDKKQVLQKASKVEKF